ncbi:hypothetical protein PF003_g35816 [Phytophthora fragariae]|nr:hypothetical protein PF003_g35816 [Phytophthora fragariae]
MASTSSVLRLYREMLRNAAKFETYNFRSYATRRVKEDFRKNKTLQAGSAEQEKAIEFAREQAAVLYRQVAVSKLYPPHVKSVMESINTRRTTGDFVFGVDSTPKTTSLAQAKTYEDQFNAFVDGSNVLNNPNSGNDCNDVVSKVEYLRDDLKDFTGSCFDAAALATNVANLKANPFPEHLQSSSSSLQAVLVGNGQWCCQKSKTLKEKYIEYGCPSAATDKGCVGGTGNSCSMNLCLKVYGDTIATRTIAIDAPVQTASTGVLNALPSKPTGSDASKNVYYSVPCTDFSETDSNCHYNVKLSELLKVTSSFAASFPTPLSEANKINDYVFWRYNIDGGLWQTWDPLSDSPLAFKDASTSVIVEAWTSLGRVGDAFSFDVNLFVHSTLTCASYDSMWTLLGSTKVGNAYCAYPGSDFALVKLDMTVADVIPHPTATVTGSYTGVTCEIMLKEESTTATDTTAYQLLSDATSPTITKSFAVEMVHNPHTARKTAASVSCKFTRSPHSNTIMLADDTDTNSITCHHDFTVADCDAPELFSATPAGVCADKCAGNSAPGVNEACGGTVVRSDATVTSISTTDAQCCTDCDPDLVCVAVSQTSVKRCQMPSVTPLMLAATEEGEGFASSETLVLLGASAMVAIVALVVVKRRAARPIVDEDAYYPLLE